MHQKSNVYKVEYTNNTTRYQQEETFIFDVAFSFDSFFLFVISKFMLVGVPLVRVLCVPFGCVLTDMELALRGSTCLHLSDPDDAQSPQTH